MVSTPAQAGRSQRAGSKSAQRTRFQLRQPSEREGGVCCKPELGGARSAGSSLTLEPFDVQEVLVSAGCFLVLDEVSSRKHVDALVIKRRFDPLRPDFVEIDAVDPRDDVDADRLHSNLENE